MVWQFCRFIDSKLKTNYANNYLDLVALGLCGDMMSLRSFETRYLITEGFKKCNIKNPFIEGMIEKNEFPLSKADYISADKSMACTSMGAAFFIVPFVNALTRSGTQTEKELLFKSMLDNYAFTKVLSNKRGHKEGEQETILAQALRTATNVKNRQTRAEDAGMALLESKIQSQNLLNHKILLFLLKENEIEPNIRGLVANKMMAKYQRPCLVLSYSPKERMYEGSGRGYTKTGVESFKDILEKSGTVAYAQGHDNAMGCGIPEEQIPIPNVEIEVINNNDVQNPNNANDVNENKVEIKNEEIIQEDNNKGYLDDDLEDEDNQKLYLRVIKRIEKTYGVPVVSAEIKGEKIEDIELEENIRPILIDKVKINNKETPKKNMVNNKDKYNKVINNGKNKENIINNSFNYPNVRNNNPINNDNYYSGKKPNFNNNSINNIIAEKSQILTIIQ